MSDVLSAVAGGAIALGGVVASQIFSARSANADRAFRAREARYEDRRSVAVEFLKRAREQVKKDRDWEDEHGSAPGDSYPELGHRGPEYDEAYFAVSLLAPDLASAVAAVDDAVRKAFYGDADQYQAFEDAISLYMKAATHVLAPG